MILKTNFNIKILLISLIVLIPISKLKADDSIPSKLSNSPLSISLELTTKYMWRAIEYGDAPVLY